MTFYVVLIRKHGAENVTQNVFCWFIIIFNAGKLSCKNYSIIQEHTSQIQDFFSTCVQFQDFSGHKNPNSNFWTFQDPWELCWLVSNLNSRVNMGWCKDDERDYMLQVEVMGY